MARRCIFCGKPFTGQTTNFEHVIPEWLVAEADLAKRSAPVNIFGRKFDASLNRVGAKVCKSCNDERSSLEGAAKTVYFKIRQGVPLTETDGRTLLDWLDKVRIGMWLWANSAAPPSAKVEPKFYINQRMGSTDRIAAIAKYSEEKVGRGILFHGIDPLFSWAPSVFGFLVNNIAFFSFSSEFLLARHLRQLRISRTLHDTDHQSATVELVPQAGSRIYMLGSPYLFGQCVLTTDIFDELSLTSVSVNARNQLGEGSIVKLTPSLTEAGTDLGVVPYVEAKYPAHFILQELNAVRVNKFLMEEYLRTDFSKLSDVKHRKNAISNATFFAHQKAEEARVLAAHYERETNIKLFRM